MKANEEKKVVNAEEMAEVEDTAVKTEEKEVGKKESSKKEAAPKTEKKAAAKKETKTTKTASKAKTTKAAKADTEKEEAAPKKTTAKRSSAKKAEIMASVTLQFDGKAYTEKELTTIAKDVWKFDLGREEAEIEKIELYVKPEEGVCYYVFNGEITGSFRV